MVERGERPAEAPTDWVEVECISPSCERSVWVPPNLPPETLTVCSAGCATATLRAMPEGTAVAVADITEPSLGHRIDRLFAYVALDEDGEGIVAMTVPGLGSVPMIGADTDRMLSLRPKAIEIAKASGRRIKLVRFDSRTEVEEF